MAARTLLRETAEELEGTKFGEASVYKIAHQKIPGKTDQIMYYFTFHYEGKVDDIPYDHEEVQDVRTFGEEQLRKLIEDGMLVPLHVDIFLNLFDKID